MARDINSTEESASWIAFVTQSALSWHATYAVVGIRGFSLGQQKRIPRNPTDE